MSGSPIASVGDPVSDLFTKPLNALRRKYKHIMLIEKLAAGKEPNTEEESLLSSKDAINLLIKSLEDQRTSLASSLVLAEELTSPKYVLLPPPSPQWRSSCPPNVQGVVLPSKKTLSSGNGIATVMRQSAHDSILTQKQSQDLEERLILFLQGYIENGHYFYKEAAKDPNLSTLYIHYQHLECFDPSLADTVHMFFKSVQIRISNAVQAFLNQETNGQQKGATIKICDLPLNSSFISLMQFWSLPGHNPFEKEEICCGGGTTLRVTKATPSGRIPVLNLLMKLFSSHGNRKTWEGSWSINDVMVNDKYEVQIQKPYSSKFTKDGVLKDFFRCADDVIPQLQCGDRLPAFFGPLRNSLKKLLVQEPYITSPFWEKFFEFCTTHMALKASSRRYTFLDNMHEIMETLAKGAQELLSMLRCQAISYDWTSFLNDAHNLKKKIRNEWKNTTREGRTKGVGTQTDFFDENKDIAVEWKENEELAVEGKGNEEIVVEVKPTGVKGSGVFRAEVKEEDLAPSPSMLNDASVFRCHVKQHGSKGMRDVKGKRHLRKLSEIDLVTSYYLQLILTEIIFSLIHYIDADLRFDEIGRNELLIILQEILQEYNRTSDGFDDRELVHVYGERVVVWVNISCDSEEQYQIVDDYFLTRSYISGFQFSQDDIVAFDALASAPPTKYINFKRWYDHIDALLKISGIQVESCVIKEKCLQLRQALLLFRLQGWAVDVV